MTKETVLKYLKKAKLIFSTLIKENYNENITNKICSYYNELVEEKSNLTKDISKEEFLLILSYFRKQMRSILINDKDLSLDIDQIIYYVSLASMECYE